MKNNNNDVSVKDLNRGGMFEDENITYNQNLYYITSSGILERLPDQIEERARIRSEVFPHTNGDFK